MCVTALPNFLSESCGKLSQRNRAVSKVAAASQTVGPCAGPQTEETLDEAEGARVDKKRTNPHVVPRSPSPINCLPVIRGCLLQHVDSGFEHAGRVGGLSPRRVCRVNVIGCLLLSAASPNIKWPKYLGTNGAAHYNPLHRHIIIQQAVSDLSCTVSRCGFSDAAEKEADVVPCWGCPPMPQTKPRIDRWPWSLDDMIVWWPRPASLGIGPLARKLVLGKRP